MARLISAKSLDPKIYNKERDTLDTIREGNSFKLLPQIDISEDVGSVLTVTSKGLKIIGSLIGNVDVADPKEVSYDFSPIEYNLKDDDFFTIFLQPSTTYANVSGNFPKDSIVPFTYQSNLGEAPSNIIAGLLGIINASDYSTEVSNRYSFTNVDGVLTVIAKNGSDDFPIKNLRSLRGSTEAYISTVGVPVGDVSFTSLTHLRGDLSTDTPSNFEITLDFPYENNLGPNQFLGNIIKVTLGGYTASLTVLSSHIKLDIETTFYKIMEALKIDLIENAEAIQTIEIVPASINRMIIVKTNTSPWFPYSATTDAFEKLSSDSSNTLVGLTDTNFGTLDAGADGKSIIYDDGFGEFILSTTAGGGSSTLNDLTDTNLGTLSSATDGKALVYQTSTDKFVMQPRAQGGSYAIAQKIFVLDSTDVANGYVTLVNAPYEPKNVRFYLLDGAEQINKGIIGSTGVTPDFKLETSNPLRVVFDDTDLSTSTLIDGDEIRIEYYTDYQASGGGSYAFKQDLFKIDSEDLSNGYLTLSQDCYVPADVRLLDTQGNEYVNSGIVGTTGVTPDFEMDNTNTKRLYFQNVYSHSGLSEIIVSVDDVLKVSYFTDFVLGTTPSNLEDMADVNLTTEVSEDGKFLKYDDASGKFVLETISGTNPSMESLTDTEFGTLGAGADGKSIVYDHGSGDFILETITGGSSGSAHQVFVEGDGNTDTTTSGNNATAIQNALTTLSGLGGGELILTGTLALPGASQFLLTSSHSNITIKGLNGAEIVPDDSNTTSITTASSGSIASVFVIGDGDSPVSNMIIEGISFNYSSTTVSTGYSLIGLRCAEDFIIRDNKFLVSDLGAVSLIKIDNGTNSAASLKNIYFISNNVEAMSTSTSDVGHFILMVGRNKVVDRAVSNLVILENNIRSSRPLSLSMATTNSADAQWDLVKVEKNQIQVERPNGSTNSSYIYGIRAYYGNKRCHFLATFNNILFNEVYTTGEPRGFYISDTKCSILNNDLKYAPTTYGSSDTPTGIHVIGSTTYTSPSIIRGNQVHNFCRPFRTKMELIKELNNNVVDGDVSLSDFSITAHYTSFDFLYLESGSETSRIKRINHNTIKNLEVTNGSRTLYFIRSLGTESNVEIRSNFIEETVGMATGGTAGFYFSFCNTTSSKWTNFLITDNKFLTKSLGSDYGIMKTHRYQDCIIANNQFRTSDDTVTNTSAIYVRGSYVERTWFLNNILFANNDLSHRFVFGLSYESDLNSTNRFEGNEVRGFDGETYSNSGSTVTGATTSATKKKFGLVLNGHGFDSLIRILPTTEESTELQNAQANLANIQEYSAYMDESPMTGLLFEGEYTLPIDLDSTTRTTNIYYNDKGYFGSHSGAVFKPYPSNILPADDASIIGTGKTVTVSSSSTLPGEAFRYTITGDYSSLGIASPTDNDYIGHLVTISGFGGVQDVSRGEIIYFYPNGTSNLIIEVVNPTGATIGSTGGISLTLEGSDTFSGSTVFNFRDLTLMENITWDYSECIVPSNMMDGVLIKVQSNTDYSRMIQTNVVFQNCNFYFGKKEYELVLIEKGASLDTGYSLQIDNCKFIVDIHSIDRYALMVKTFQKVNIYNSEFRGGRLLLLAPYNIYGAGNESFIDITGNSFILNSFCPDAITSVKIDSNTDAHFKTRIHSNNFYEASTHATPIETLLHIDSGSTSIKDCEFKVYSLFLEPTSIDMSNYDNWDSLGSLIYINRNNISSSLIEGCTFNQDYGNLVLAKGSGDLGSNLTSQSFTFKGNEILARSEFGSITAQVASMKGFLNTVNLIQTTTTRPTADLPGTPWMGDNPYGGSTFYDGSTYYYVVLSDQDDLTLFGQADYLDNYPTYYVDFYDGSTFLGTFSTYRLTENLKEFDLKSTEDTGKTGTLLWFKMGNNAVSSTSFNKELTLKLIPYSRTNASIITGREFDHINISDTLVHSVASEDYIFHLMVNYDGAGYNRYGNVQYSNIHVRNQIYGATQKTLTAVNRGGADTLFTDDTTGFTGIVEDVLDENSLTGFLGTEGAWYLINTEGSSATWTGSNYKSYVGKWVSSNWSGSDWVSKGINYTTLLKDDGVVYRRVNTLSDEKNFEIYTCKFQGILADTNVCTHSLRVDNFVSDAIVTEGSLINLESSGSLSFETHGHGNVILDGCEWRSWETSGTPLLKLKSGEITKSLRLYNNTLYLEHPSLIDSPVVFDIPENNPIIVSGESNLLMGPKFDVTDIVKYGKTTSSLCGHVDLNQLDTHKDEITGHIELPDDKVYRLSLGLLYDGILQTIKVVTSSGTCDVTFRINDGNTGGVGNSEVTVSGVSSTLSTEIINYEFTKNDTLAIEVDNGVSPEDLQFSIEIERKKKTL